MGHPRIVLTGLGPKVEGLRWEFERSFRLGRQGNLDIVLRDYSVERIHAEIKFTGVRWMIRDLADDERFPTLINGVTLAGGHQELSAQDMLQVGELFLKVVELEGAPPDLERSTAPDPGATRVLPEQTPQPALGKGSGILQFVPPLVSNNGREVGTRATLTTSFADMEIRATARHSWDQALEHVADDTRTVQGPAMLALLRANHHLSNLSNLEELLNSILTDAIATLNAQSGAVLLADPVIDQLVLKASAAPKLPHVRKAYSKTLVERCFGRGESLLCQDVHADEALVCARSVKQGAMSSVICTLLRTPRKRLGVLHLDRGPFDAPFNENDLYLADAIAASVAVGIECAQVVEHQREQFIETVTTLARAVEMRDQYTGDHTRRVTDYALLLADALNVGSPEKYQIQVGTPLHDIGKIGIDDAILRKPGKLTAGEFNAMKAHTLKGAAILESIGSLNPMIPIVRHHHERWDGTGYPDGLGRDKIALTARIVAVADAFDAMTSHRPYRPAMPAQLAFLELLSKAGTHFDPVCVQGFLRVRARIEAMLKAAKESAAR